MAVEMTVPRSFNKEHNEGRVDYDWVIEDNQDIFEGKRVVVFAPLVHLLILVVVHTYPIRSRV